MEDAIQLLVDKNMLEDVVRQQDMVISKQVRHLALVSRFMEMCGDVLYEGVL